MRLTIYIAASVLLAVAFVAISPGRGGARAQQATPAVAVPQSAQDGVLDDVFFYSGANLPDHAAGRVELTKGDGTFTEFPPREDFSNTFDVYPGDFNGDGLTDMFFYNFNGGENDAVVLLSDGQGGWIDQPAFHIDAEWTVTPGNYNDDARTDLFFYNVNTGDAIVDFANEDATFSQGTLGNLGTGWRREPGFFNSDGLTDLVFFNLDHVNSEQMEVLLAMGDGNWSIQAPMPIAFDAFVYPGDYNGDGNGDVLVVDGSTNPMTTADVYYGDGNGGLAFGPRNNDLHTGWGVFPGDYDGDGSTDIFTYDAATGTAQFMFANPGQDWSEAPIDHNFDAHWRVFPGHFIAGPASTILLYNGATAAPTPALAVVIPAIDRSGDWGQSAAFQPGDDFAQVVLGSFGPPQVWGDADCDGELAPRDGQAILKIVLQQTPLAQTQPCQAVGSEVHVNSLFRFWGDSDCSGDITPRDGQAILKAVLTLPPLSQTEPCPDVGATVDYTPVTPP